MTATTTTTTRPTPDYATHPETQPAIRTGAGGDLIEVVGTVRDGIPETGRRAITVTMAGSGQFYTARSAFSSRDMRTRAGCIKWLKKVLAHESLDAKWYV